MALAAANSGPVPPSTRLPCAPRPGRPAASREEALAEVAKRVAACTRCPVLVANRTQTVFGVGNPHSKLVFVGEAPGADEDRQGEPFVGRAGQLLTDIITKGMKLRREDVYIMNILRCRPPDNRTPLPTEAANCREYLDAQLAIIQPRFICCLGACAAQNLLQVDTPIGKLRGRMIDFNGMKVLCTYHPAYRASQPARQAAGVGRSSDLDGRDGAEVARSVVGCRRGNRAADRTDTATTRQRTTMFETFDHTADVGLRIRAADLDTLFADAARAMFSVMAGNLGAVRPTEEVRITLGADDLDALLRDWLGELLYTFHVRKLVFSDFSVAVAKAGCKPSPAASPWTRPGMNSTWRSRPSPGTA